MFSFFQRHSHIAVLFLRIGTGFVFIYHGYNKIFAPGGIERFTGYLSGLGFPLPSVLAYTSGGVEFFGGCMLALGLLTRQASLLLIVNMLVAVFIAHRHDTYPQKEHAIQMLVLSIGTLYSGSGAFSLENLVKKHGD
ncbi:MAG TPA: DoxX family protein [bacterium]|nr:DoxX family protein [bacterium]HMZ05221.1 DoxX family protein [bacterium]HNB10042.1 DoxX family protein [bacterium]HNB56556.1 DoxX family protein [bacterium]HNC48277.1 DoxX family protein [bacterium]